MGWILIENNIEELVEKGLLVDGRWYLFTDGKGHICLQRFKDDAWPHFSGGGCDACFDLEEDAYAFYDLPDDVFPVPRKI